MANDENETEFLEHLACHGSDVQKWPEPARTLGAVLQEYPEAGALIEDEKRFERMLHERYVAPARPQLAQRIIAASIAADSAAQNTWQPSELLVAVRPATLAAMLVLSFVVGFGAFAPSPRAESTASMQSYIDEDGAIL
jgi:hypothetical protein